MRCTNAVVEFIRDLEYEVLPGEVIDQAKRCILDLLGVALAGTKTRSSSIARRFALDGFGEGFATVIGEERMSTAPGAAWANCQTSCALDMDDGHNLAVGHPGSVVIPAALAVAECRQATGRELLEGVVAGYEVSVRIAGSRVPEYIHTYASGVWGVYGAALAAAKILELTEEQMVHTIGIAGCHGPARPHSKNYDFVPMLKECIGWAGMAGASAALLAEQGYTGFTDLLEYSEFFDGGLLLKGLGTEYEIMRVWFKPYSSCRWTHSSIEAALLLRHKYGISKEKIRSITVRSFERASIMSSVRPTASETAQYSIPWCVAAAIIDGKVGPEEVSEERLNDPEILDLAAKVKIVYDDNLQKQFPMKFPAVVEIETDEGTMQAKVDSPKGDMEDPMTHEEVEKKFYDLTIPVVGPAKAEELKSRVMNLEAEDDLSRIMALLRK